MILNLTCRMATAVLVFVLGLKFYNSNVLVVSILLMIQNFVFSFFNTINMVIPTEMIGDTVDYMEWKTGKRLTGMGSAVQSFVAKLGNAVSTSFIVLMYMIVHLDVANISANVTANPLEMSETIRTGMFSLVSIIPGISLLICIVPIFFYDLVGEKKKKITKELEEQRKAKGIIIE